MKNLKRISLVLLAVCGLATLPPDRATPVSRGGTGSTSLTANNVILGNGTSAVQFVAPGTSGNVLKSNGTTWASTADTGGGGGLFAVTQNLLTNPSWETDTSSWTASGGTYTRTTTAANIIPPGVGAGDWDSNASSQTLTSNSTTITSADGLSGRNGVVSCAIRAASGTATHTIQAYDGTNILVSQTVTSSTSGFVRTSANFIFPASGTVSARIVSVASNEPEIYIDDCYLGLAEAFNLTQVSQTQYVGGGKWTGVTSCAWNTTSASFANFAADTDCNNPTVSGSATAPGTKIPGLVFSSLSPGRYLIIAKGFFYRSHSAASSAGFRFSDGTNSSTVNGVYGNTGGSSDNSIGSVIGEIEYTTAQGSTTIQLQGFTNGGTAATLTNATPTFDFEISVYRFPSSTEQAVRPDLINWRVDANISGANPSLGSSAQTAYVGIENSALTLVNNSGNGVLTAQVPCSSTNASSGTTCSVGNESVGVVFSLPQAGDVEACVEFSHQADVTGGKEIAATFQIVETPNNAQTISQEGKSRVQSGNDVTTASTRTTVYNPHKLCGTFTFSSAGQKTLRLFYELAVGGAGTINANTVLADAGTSNGQRDIHWTVKPVNVVTPAPILVGSVTSNSTGAERVERATVTYSGGVPSVARQSGSWVTSVTDNATGDATLVVPSGTFTATPTCVCSVTGASTPGGTCQVDSTTTSTTAVRVAMRIYDAVTQNGTTSDKDFNVICMGPR